MYIKAGKKNIGISLLLCCLFLTSYLSVLNTFAPVSSAPDIMSAVPSAGAGSESSMSGGAAHESFDYLSAADTFLGLTKSPAGQTRGQSGKLFFDLFCALTAAQFIRLICSSRLSAGSYTPFNSISIITFLHKKDGRK